MFGNFEVSDYKNDRRLKINVNAYWITIVNEEGTVVFKRNPDDENWRDVQHVEITNALNALEDAVLKACAVIPPET